MQLKSKRPKMTRGIDLGFLDKTTETETETNYNRSTLPPVDDPFFRIITCSVVFVFSQQYYYFEIWLECTKKVKQP